MRTKLLHFTRSASKQFDSSMSTLLHFLMVTLLIGSSFLTGGCAGDRVHSTNDIVATLEDTSLTGAPGQTVTQTISVTNRTTLPLMLTASATCSDLKSQLTPSPSSVNLASSSSTQIAIPFTIPSTAKEGDVLHCYCTLGSGISALELDWTVFVSNPPTGTFTVTSDYTVANQLPLVPNGNASATVTIFPKGGFTGPVSISIATTDAGVTATQNPVTVNVGSGPKSTAVTLHWDGKGTSVGGLCTLTATAGSITQTCSFAYQGGS